MPINSGYEIIDGDQKGFYRYGKKGKKYYYTPGDDEGREKAYNKALKQMKAIKANE